MTHGNAFDPKSTYIHLAQSGAREVPVSETFWPDLISGKTAYPGRLVMTFPMTEDFPHWERHPQGEEVIVMLSGAMDVILDEPDANRTVRLETGQAMLVPKNIWHRGVVVEPGEALFVTEGEGTDHRPITEDERRG